MKLTLDMASRIIDGALAEARRRKTKPLSVIVLDNGAHPITFKREDGASFLRLGLAHGKAVAALGFGQDSGAVAVRAQRNPTFFLSAARTANVGPVFSAGGLLIRDAGEILGAVGVSGDTSEIDEACAGAGLRVAGFDIEAGDQP